MCDYSLHLEMSRPARVGEKLVSTRFASSATMPHTAAGPHPFDTAGGQQARGSVGVLIADAALRNVGKGSDAGVGMESETGEWVSLSVEDVKEYEGFQETAKVGRRHQACDRSVILSAGTSGNAGKRKLRHDVCDQRTSSGFVVGFQVRHELTFLQLRRLERSRESRSCMHSCFP